MSRPRSDRPGFGTVVSHLGVFVAVAAVMGLLVAGLVIPFAGALGIGTDAAADSMKNLPKALRTEPLEQSTRVLGRNGQVIASFYNQNRTTVQLKQIAPIMRKAIVAIEDYRFYQHGAIDLKGTLRAFVTNQTNGGVTQGGSTITQQMAKMTEVDQARTKAARVAATADTYQRKLQELRHAIAYEQNYSKNWILQRYLNIAYFGDGAYGVQVAAQHYFGVNASQLSTKQAATIAGLVKNPNGYDPITNPENGLARRNIVLARMAQLKVISQATADKLEAQGLGLNVQAMPNGCVASSAPFFCDYVRRYLLADPSLGRTVAARSRLLNEGGLTIKTTVDLRFQRAATAAARARVSPTDNAVGALAMVQPGTGEVFAIGQSRPMGNNRKRGQTYLDYAVPTAYGGAAGFQGGSTFKLFVLGAALDSGIPVTTSFNSPPELSIPQNEFPDCNGMYPSTQIWQVHNSTTSGYTSMTVGARESVNTYFAQLEKQVGLCKPFALSRQMGIKLPISDRVPSFTLGVGDVDPVEMAAAYATPAARGLFCEPRPVTEILNAADKVFKTYPKQCRQVMTTNTADTINQILAGVMAPGGFGEDLTLDKPSAGKTGTTDDNFTVWFDGYTPAMATSAVVAGANYVGTPITLNGQVLNGSYVPTAHGSTTAGPMWAQAMRAIENLLPNKAFVSPTASTTGAQISTPDVTGQTIAQATSNLQAAGLQVLVANPIASSQPKGTVAMTSPQPGDPSYTGSTVYLFPSKG